MTVPLWQRRRLAGVTRQSDGIESRRLTDGRVTTIPTICLLSRNTDCKTVFTADLLLRDQHLLVIRVFSFGSTAPDETCSCGVW